MKAKLAIALTIALTLTPITAHAEEVGGWALLDANNNVITVDVCTASVCGDPNSDYSKARLQPGQRYIQQTNAHPDTGNVAGYSGPGVSYIPQIDSFAQLTISVDTEDRIIPIVNIIPKGTIPGYEPPKPVIEPTPPPASTDTVDRSTSADTTDTVTTAKVKKTIKKKKAKAKKTKKAKR